MREIVPLPELTPLDETPGYVAGVANLRGQIVPAIDLNLRFGHPPQHCRLEDCIIVLERAGSAVGIVVNEVQNVRDIAPAEMEPVPSYGGAEAQSDSRFLAGLVKAGEQVVMLLNLENLLRLSHSLEGWSGAAGTLPPAGPQTFCPDATAQERAVFRERARSLAQPTESQDLAGLLPLAVVRLGEEFFGIELQAIREFAELRSVTPVPCCPEHVVGQMNLRGDLITLMDIAKAMGLPAASARAGCKVVVLNNVELRAGVLVDEVLDVLYLPATDVTPVPASARASGQEYLRGTAPHGSRMLSLLDLPTLLMQESLIVNEEP